MEKIVCSCVSLLGVILLGCGVILRFVMRIWWLNWIEERWWVRFMVILLLVLLIRLKMMYMIELLFVFLMLVMNCFKVFCIGLLVL